MPTAGTAGWRELRGHDRLQLGYHAARNWAEDHTLGFDHVFITDGVNGYLFGDIDGDAWIETGIVLEGITSIDDFHYWDIIFSDRW